MKNLFLTLVCLITFATAKAKEGDVTMAHQALNPNSISFIAQEKTVFEIMQLGNLVSYYQGQVDIKDAKAIVLEAMRLGHVVDIFRTEGTRRTVFGLDTFHLRSRPASIQEQANYLLKANDEIIRLQNENQALRSAIQAMGKK